METEISDEETAILLGREQILARLLDKIWNAILVVTIVGGTASILRSSYTGWLPIYNVHVLLVVSYLIFWWFRNKLSFNARVAIILALFYAVGIIGIFTFGVLGAGIWWLIICAFVANMFYTQPAGIIHGLFCLAIIIVAGIAITSGAITVPFDANEYITRPTTWLTLMIGCVFLSLFIFGAITLYQKEILKLLSEVEKSRKRLEELNREQQQALDEIRSLRKIMPICANCKKIRDDEGFWEHVEAYMLKHADMKFSHGLCPSCGEMLYGSDWNAATQEGGKDPGPSPLDSG